MLRKALTIVVLLGIATAAGAARADERRGFGASIVIGHDTMHKVTSERFRGRHDFRHGPRVHKGFGRPNGHGKRYHGKWGYGSKRYYGRNKRYGAKRYDYRRGAVIVRPAYGKAFHRHLPVRPLFRNGFGWRSYR